MGHVAPRPPGVAPVPGNKLVRQRNGGIVTIMKLPSFIRRPLHDLITNHTPRCTEIGRLISQSTEHKLPLYKQIEMRIHFMVCVWCVRYSKQLMFLREAVPFYSDKIGLISGQV